MFWIVTVILIIIVIVSFDGFERSEYIHNKHRKNRIKKISEISITKESLVFIGDSIIELNNWGKNLPEYQNNILNFGISGEKIEELFQRINTIADFQPRLFILETGINDILAHTNKDVILIHYERIVNLIKEKSPHSIVFIISILPVSSDRLNNNNHIFYVNKRIKNLALKNNLVFVDLYSDFLDEKKFLSCKLTNDGLHPNCEGYKIMEKVIMNKINIFLNNTEKTKIYK